MRVVEPEPIELVLRGSGRVGGEPCADAADRRAVSADAVLWQPQDGEAVWHRARTCEAADAADGNRGDLPQAASVPSYPYLLRNVAIVRPDQVWSSDITFVPMPRGWMYLTVVMDWFSRYVLSWRLSNTLDGLFCLEALDEALSQRRPEIFNTDQGSQYTAEAFTGRLEAAGVAVSMDGRGRWMDNVFVERLWRTVKYELVYLHDYATPWALEQGLVWYFPFYNERRIHESLDYSTPAAVYRAGRDVA